MGLLRLFFFEILEWMVDVKMWSHSRGQGAIFGFSLPNSRVQTTQKAQQVIALTVVAVLTDRNSPTSFFTSVILYCLMLRQWWLRQRKESWLLAQDCSSLAPWRMKGQSWGSPMSHVSTRNYYYVFCQHVLQWSALERIYRIPIVIVTNQKFDNFPWVC